MTVRGTVVGFRFEIVLVLVVTLMPAISAAQGRGAPPPGGGGPPALEAQVGALEAQLEDLNAALSALSSQVSAQLTTLQQLVEQFNQALGTAETKVANLEGQLAALEEHVNGLGGGLTSYDQLAGLPCVTAANADGTVLLLGLLKSAVCAAGMSTNGRFLDLGPIIVDSQRNVMWEKKDDTGGLHDVDNRYHWCPAQKGETSVRDICTNVSHSWIDQVNEESFAGFSNWRVPTEDELLSIIDDTAGPPRIDPIFGLTQAAGYWTLEEDLVNFLNGGTTLKPIGDYAVRAVRSIQEPATAHLKKPLGF